MRSFLLLLLLATPLAPMAPALAQPAAEAPVSVEVALVRATRGSPAVDPALASMAAALKSLPFQTFASVGTGGWSAPSGRQGKADLPLGVEVKATVTKATGDSATVDVTVTRGGREVAHTTFERPWGLAHVLSVGREGDATLLVPVRVSR